MSTLDKQTMVTLTACAVAVFMLASAGVAYLGSGASMRDVALQEQQLQVLHQQLDQASAQAVTRPAASPQRWQLCGGPEVVTTMQVVQALADQAGVMVERLTAMRSADTAKQAFEVHGHGNPDMLCAFVAAIEQDQRLVILETGRLMPAPGGEIAFQFGLATYFHVEAK